VGPVGIVLSAPVADEDLGFGEAGELLDVEQLLAHPAAVRVDSGVLPGRARLDVAGTLACEAAPVPQGVRGELGAVVAAHEAQMPAALGGGERGQGLCQVSTFYTTLVKMSQEGNGASELRRTPPMHSGE
jgi:hypothetical protein